MRIYYITNVKLPTTKEIVVLVPNIVEFSAGAAMERTGGEGGRARTGRG